ncbi:FAD-dependent monooxygenase [Micromonospora auratinigra]|uniref:2-polyprenyl-6-methoxyphenol hydroxylase n=1 Tax=Micromonospora auratinigra TaxID=261654 RepID=A0A1A8ZFX6_9ACTN|nr:FAD-dependent monooxygenase [Micromonospora auratinigra]SBT42911.1 2-polyprenyl-6-methoxyphenol hydroxylase [Micromonospora auratinigra]
MEDVEVDICVVGAGPAGLTLALLLLRSGVRVAVVEKATGLDRQFRGEILQPGGQAVLDRLGVLAGARERGAVEHDGFQLVQRGRVLIDGDYRRLPGPFNCLLSIPQPHVLAVLLAACEGYDGFRWLPGHKVTALLDTDGRVAGVRCAGPGGERVVTARCVVGADGRYSKVRRLAGIDPGRHDVFDQDVVWCKLPAPADAPYRVQIFRADGNPVLTYRSVPEQLQLGWTLPHGGWREVTAGGIDAVRARIRAAAPPYADLVDAHLRSLRDLTLLDVFSARAPEWTRDGLLLVGDAAHTHSPIGAQGINLALQDAVAAHPVLVAAVRAGHADRALLERFTARRRREIAAIGRIQRVQSGAMLAAGRVAGAVRPRLAGVASRTPLYRAVLGRIAFGDRSLRIAEDLLTHDPAGRQPCA